MSIVSTCTATISTYTFKDYSENCTGTYQQSNNGVFTARYSQFDADFVYYNTNENPNVINEDGLPYDYARPCEICFNDPENIISGVSAGAEIEQFKKLGAMNPKVSYDNTQQMYILSFTLNNLSFYLQSSESGKVSGNSIYNKIVPEQNFGDKAVMSGNVYNSKSGSKVNKVQIDFRTGTDNKDSAPAATYTGDDGTYYIEIEPGDYTIEVHSGGFVPAFFNMSISAGELDRDFEIDPISEEDAIRVVVEWSKNSTHVTSHAYCISPSGFSMGEIGDYEGYYGDTLYNGDTLLADYKRDEADKIDAVTFYDPDGTYEFHVHYDYDADDVRVNLYMPGSSTPIVIKNPQKAYCVDTSGFRYWIPFEIEAGKVVAVHGDKE